MDLSEKIVLFRLNWRGRRELKGIEFFVGQEVFEAPVLNQDGAGVWIRPTGEEVREADRSGPAELLKWEYIATATVHVEAGQKA